MSRKQVDFIIRLVRIAPNPAAVDQSMSTADFSKWVKENYLDQGWEVMGVQQAQVEANSVFFAVYLAKYEEVNVVAPSPRRGRPVKRHPEEDVAG